MSTVVRYWTREPGGTWSGPWTSADLVSRRSRGEIGPDTPCCVDGSAEVFTISQIGQGLDQPTGLSMPPARVGCFLILLACVLYWVVGSIATYWRGPSSARNAEEKPRPASDWPKGWDAGYVLGKVAAREGMPVPTVDLLNEIAAHAAAKYTGPDRPGYRDGFWRGFRSGHREASKLAY